MARIGLPKKYAKMGFKKGWKAFKASKRKASSRRKSPTRKKTKSRSRVRTISTRRRTSKKVQRKMSKNRGFNVLGIKFNQSDLFEIAGASGAGALGGLVSQASNNALTGNTAQAVGGLALGMLGGKNAKSVAKGVLMKTTGDFVEDNVVPKLGGLVSGMGGQVSQNATPGVVIIG